MGGVLLGLGASFVLARRRNVLDDEFAALAREFDWSPVHRNLIGKPTRVPTYIAPTDEVVLLDRRVRRVSLRARVLNRGHSRKDRELNF